MDKKISSTVTFADVAHQSLCFDRADESSRLVLDLLDTEWVQRLRHIKQTGNTNLVYMFAEHSRFGHSLGVAYLAIMLMDHFEKFSPELVRDYRSAVAAAAMLHDIGHCAPGSHLAERVWAQPGSKLKHEQLTMRIIREADSISNCLERYEAGLVEKVCGILSESSDLPNWTHAMISGGGWNADRGNWAIVDSAMCSVSYGRYNVAALIDAFRLTENGDIVLRENRLDALTHFFVARDSMYRQVYQHRVLQAADALNEAIIRRIRQLLGTFHSRENSLQVLAEKRVYCDDTMLSALVCENYTSGLSLCEIYNMTEHWWNYHLEKWCSAQDSILADLSSRLFHRRLFKTIRIPKVGCELHQAVLDKTCELGFDPDYYVLTISEADSHRENTEEPPLVLLENGKIVSVTEVEPLIASILKRQNLGRAWLAVPAEVKDAINS